MSDQRLKFLDVPSLELRHLGLRADLYWCYKILFGLVAVTPDVFSPRILVAYFYSRSLVQIV